MFAGSLMSGCSFDVTCFSIHGELGRGCWHLGDHRAMQGDLGAHRRRPWVSRLGFLSILEGFRGRHLDVFGQLWHNNCVFWHACLQVTFFKDFGSESGCLGLQNQAFGVEGIAKTSFSHMSGLCRFWCHFYMVFDGFGTNFNDFWWPGARLGTS